MEPKICTNVFLKRKFLYVFIFFVFLGVYFTYTNVGILNIFAKLEYKPVIRLFIGQSKNNTSTKNILYWNKFFSKSDMNLGLGSKIFENCPAKNCYTTNNKSLMNIDDFDAIVFHIPTFKVEESGIPQRRKINQKYIFFR